MWLVAHLALLCGGGGGLLPSRGVVRVPARRYHGSVPFITLPMQARRRRASLVRRSRSRCSLLTPARCHCTFLRLWAGQRALLTPGCCRVPLCGSGTCGAGVWGYTSGVLALCRERACWLVRTLWKGKREGVRALLLSTFSGAVLAYLCVEICYEAPLHWVGCRRTGCAARFIDLFFPFL